MKTLFLFFVLVFQNVVYSQNSLMPKDYEEFLIAKGDLDKDSIDEEVIIYMLKNPIYKIDSNSKDSTKFEYELIIFKIVDNKRTIWQRSVNAILEIEDYLRKEDYNNDEEFNLDIKKGLLIISYGQGIGGNNTRSDYTYKYRFQNNEFQLIGYNYKYGQFCRGAFSVDYNISTGKIIIEQLNSNCIYDSKSGEEIDKFKVKTEVFNYKLKEKITLQNIFNIRNHIISPKYKIEITIP